MQLIKSCWPRQVVGHGKSVTNRVIIGVTPFKVLITSRMRAGRSL